jgi:8-oxo-dGTP diphosphatase
VKRVVRSTSVGALVFDGADRVLLSLRGAGARNEAHHWEFPGGSVAFGETLLAAVHRELHEEHGIEIEVDGGLLCVVDHLLPNERQHWVAVAYMARHVGGTAEVREPDRCDDVGWFPLGDLPSPLTKISEICVEQLAAARGSGGLSPAPR